ncbi:Transcription factor bHLH [Abeliophyllum distichum]|uniref:Transcription factor bHLH n=1 Tax=Abeliophyllum distichum TaxID=126358 RepID=A0ABD1R9V3_9LAMI
MMNCPRPWARICQDTITNGKAGTKIQCLTSAGSAFMDGKSVFIDRCNLDREQRVDFLNLGGPQVEKHAVVLHLPAKLCISRSEKRSGHEGNLQGRKAAAVVNRMLQKKDCLSWVKVHSNYILLLDCDKVEMTSVADGNASDNIPTLAFPSISTADFQFNLEKASDIIVEKVEEFISKIGKARLVLVDLSHGSKIVSG